MKTKFFIAMALIAIITVTVIGCKQEPTPVPVQREFNDLTLVRGKIITLIDETGGATDLKAQGIWQKFNEAFGEVALGSAAGTKFDNIYNNGGKITIKVGVSGPESAVSGHEINFSLEFVNSNNATYIANAISSLIEYDVVE
jgi:hypothetical protein